MVGFSHAGWWQHVALVARGFEVHGCNGLVYYTLNVPSATDGAALAPIPTPGVPLLFLHGIGVGLLPYIPFLFRLMREFDDRPVVVLDLEHIAMRAFGVRSCEHVMASTNLARAATLQACYNLYTRGLGLLLVC